MGVVVERFDVFLAIFDPTVGSEIKKTRPCLVISPDEMNRNIQTVIIAPMTTKGQRKERSYPTRIDCQFQGKKGRIVLDQLRTVNKSRLIKKSGKISPSTQESVIAKLTEIFSK